MKINKKATRIIIYILLIVATFYSIFPIIWMGTMSIRPNNEVFQTPPQFIPDTFTLEGYEKVFKTRINMRYLLNSYVVAIGVTILTIFISLFAAYGFSRFDFKGKAFLNYFIIATQTIPPITLLIPYFGFIVAFRLLDTYTALILTYIGFTLPYSILMLIGYLNTLPTELDDAVLIDGGSRFVALVRVIAPLSLPGIIATAVYTFLLSWNEFMFALTLTQTNEMRTIPIGIALLMGQHAYEWNVMMSLSLVGSLPVLILYLLGQRYFISGMTAGSIKT